VGERFIYVYDETVHNWLPVGGIMDLDLERFQTQFIEGEFGNVRTPWPFWGFDPKREGQEPDFFNIYQSGKFVFFENLPNVPGGIENWESDFENWQRWLGVAEVAFHTKNRIAVWYYRTRTGQVFFNHKDLWDGWGEWREVCFGCDFDQDVSDGRTPEFRTHEGWFQWKYTDEEEWNNLYPVPDDGTNAKEVEFRYYDGWLQWRYVGETWQDLVQIMDGDADVSFGGECRLQIQDVTMLTGGWALESDRWVYSYEDDRIHINSAVCFIPDNRDLTQIIDANIYPEIDVQQGFAKVYAENQPTEDIRVTVEIYCVNEGLPPIPSGFARVIGVGGNRVVDHQGNRIIARP
jgi:hypothetical protein